MELTMVAGEPRTVQRALEKKVLAVTTHFPLSVKLGTTGKAVPSQSELVILASMPWGGFWICWLRASPVDFGLVLG